MSKAQEIRKYILSEVEEKKKFGRHDFSFVSLRSNATAVDMTELEEMLRADGFSPKISFTESEGMKLWQVDVESE